MSTTVRVNLLKPAECRHQGVVSKEFAIKVSVWGGGALLSLLLVIGLFNSQAAKRQLAASKSAWAEMEPRYERVLLMQSELSARRTIQKHLKGWSESRVNWNEKLTMLGSLVPLDVQLTKLVVRGEFVEEIHEGLPDKDGVRKKTVDYCRQFAVRMDGKAGGDRADEVVVQFVNMLRSAPSFEGTLESVKLQGLQRTTTHDGEDATVRVFGIEGLSPMRKL